MQGKGPILIFLILVTVLSAGTAAIVSYVTTQKRVSASFTIDKLRTQRFEFVDSEGRSYLSISSSAQGSRVELRDGSGQARLGLLLDPQGRPAVRLSNPDTAGPTASLEIDDKGTHVKFDRPGGASSYVFLNNEGGSGLVSLDGKGQRKLQLLVNAAGETQFQRFDLPISKEK
jgi:hypothetical protein